ncbi:eukaryotic type KH-domain (KH-domain type I) [Choiromyces venosus 120613-1]|uniref:Eukaryotic type KH-domain (KH-domain type I) n=1 Tax=Choiromyces venosus 120613-1 TaxID=1336337 RepID=A0A3N4JS50_9PEZI|nr:eukaryotic type KH-domain (KH-domain type I) [Choiromyces venosus 120613-1]
MADQNVAALLAALTSAQRPPGSQGGPPLPQGGPAGYAGIPAGLTGQPPSQSVASPPVGYSLPQPSASGSLDLSNIKPTTSGKVSLDDALARAKARAAEMGIQPTYREQAPARYEDPRSRYSTRRSRSRTRSPPSRRGGEPFRDAYNPFRDERRARASVEYVRERERSYSPPRRGGPPGASTGNPYSPPPARAERYSGGGHRARSPPPDAEQMNIESSLVGLIIGRGGETLRRVEQDTGARVQFLTNGQDRDSGGERVCNIQGTRPQIAAARRAIEQIIVENGPSGGGMGGPPGGGSGRGKFGGSGGQPNLRDGEDSIQILVPDRTVGLIIGRGGETIRDIQDKSGCHVNIVGEAKSQNGQRPVNLIGSPQAAEGAKRLIMEIVESDNAGTGPPPGILTETIRVPIDAVGMIIGKGGETIKEMQSSTGCRINVSSQFQQGDPEREIALAGTREAIARARIAIEEKVEASTRSAPPTRPSHFTPSDQQQQSQQQPTWPTYALPQPTSNSPPAPTSNSTTPATGAAAGTVPPGIPGTAQDDPYAPYGGYQAYCAMYYAMMMQQQQQQQQQQQSQGGAAPGT